jgi:hypothetical protein
MLFARIHQIQKKVVRDLFLIVRLVNIYGVKKDDPGPKPSPSELCDVVESQYKHSNIRMDTWLHEKKIHTGNFL